MSDVLDRLRAFIEQSTEDPAWYHLRLGRLAAKVMPAMVDAVGAAMPWRHLSRALARDRFHQHDPQARLDDALVALEAAAERALDEEEDR